MITEFLLCNNIALLGFHKHLRIYLFLTIEFNIIGFEDDSNIWTRTILTSENREKDFKALKSVMYKDSILLLIASQEDYYFLTVNLDSKKEFFRSNVRKIGSKDVVFPQLSCDSVYFIQAKLTKLYLYKWPSLTEVLIHQEENGIIQSLKLINPYKFEITSIVDGELNKLNVKCEHCLNGSSSSKECDDEKFEKSMWVYETEKVGLITNKTHEKTTCIFVPNNNINIWLLFCICLLGTMLTVICSIYFYQHLRERKKKLKNMYIKNNYLPENCIAEKSLHIEQSWECESNINVIDSENDKVSLADL